MGELKKKRQSRGKLMKKEKDTTKPHLYHLETLRAMSLFNFRIPPLKFQITSIGLAHT